MNGHDDHTGRHVGPNPPDATGHADTDPAVPVDAAAWADVLPLDELGLHDHRVPGAALLAAWARSSGQPGAPDPEHDDRGVIHFWILRDCEIACEPAELPPHVPVSINVDNVTCERCLTAWFGISPDDDR